ncbi:MAG: extracellular solute-binding protein [Bifidobacterium mongoliense]|nr:extracellular solute-binding protein [Bifidobacterium mongoliense]
MNTLIAANTPPDAGYPNSPMAMRLGEDGLLVNIAGNEKFADFMPQTIHWYSDKGCLSNTAVEAMGLLYDKDATTKAGLTMPTSAENTWTWDEFVEAADKLTVDANGKHPSESGYNADDVVRYGVSVPTTLQQIYPLLLSNDMHLFNKAGTKNYAASKGSVEVFQALADLVTKHRVSPSPAQASNLGSSAALLLASKRVAMVLDGAWTLLDMSQSSVNYEIAPLPRFQEFMNIVTSGATVAYGSSPNRDFAGRMVVDLADPSKSELYTKGLWMPMEKSYYTDEEKIAQWVNPKVHRKGFRTAIIDSLLDHSETYPFYTLRNFSQIESTINGTFSKMFTTIGSVKPQMRKTEDSIAGLMEGAFPDQLGGVDRGAK